MVVNARPRIFLSSVFTDPGNMLRLSARDHIIDMTGGEQPPETRPIWVAEDFSQLKQANTALSPLQKALFCVAGVRSCDYFVAILSHRAGGEVPVDVASGQTLQAPTSFFELELMAAALFRKPSFIYLHTGFRPSDKLAQFLELMRPIFPDMALERFSEPEILRRVDRLVKHVESPWLRRIPVRVPRKRLFVDTLYRLRHRPYDVRVEPPPIRFLDGRRDGSIGEAQADLVPQLLERARAEETYQDRLILLWFAIHALMGVPYTDPAFRRYIPLWEDALGSWNSSAAWFGLHGHGAMAGLAALGSLADARRAIASPTDPVHGIPHGPIASAYYSIAKQAGRREIYDLALEHLDTVLATAPENRANLIAIRGSIRLRLGDSAGAITDYEEVAHAREQLSAGVYGEALSELGYALLLAGDKREGMRKMEMGVDLLRRDPRKGFDIRATKKLAVGYAKCFDFRRALDYAALAYDMAEKSDALDQIGAIERLAKALDRLRRR